MTHPVATDFGIAVDVALPFEEADRRVRELLAEEGFGVLTEIDVQETLRRKLGVEMPRQLILGACNPPLAHQAFTAEPLVGLLLPCNVVVKEREGGGSTVAFLDPEAMLDLATNEALVPVAKEASQRLRRVAEAMAH